MQPLHVVRHHPSASGPPVVLVHGAPDRSKSFAHVVHRLADLPVTVYDRRGYGKSVDATWRPDGTFAGGFDVHAADLIDLLDGTPSVVVGQSAGGTIALLAASKAPDLFLAVGAWEPPFMAWDFVPDRAPYERTLAWGRYDDPEQLAEDFSRNMLGDERWEGLRERTQAMLRAEGFAFRADMACQDSRFFDLAEVRSPAVIGCGTATEAAFVRPAATALAATLGTDLLVIDGADHFAHTNYPEAWVELVRRTVTLAPQAG